MDAIPFGVYAAPAELFRCTVTKRISDDEQQYYVQLLHRVNAQSYAVMVASSCDDLLALHRGETSEAIKRRVLVTTISRQYFHHHCALIVAPEAEAPLYAAPAALLHDDGLRATASSAWLTYFKVLHRRTDGSVFVCAASLPHRVDADRASFTTLTGEQFAQALPLSRRELNLATCDLLELVEAHAEAVTGRPVEHLAPVVRMDEEDERDAQSTPVRSYPPEVLTMIHTQQEREDNERSEVESVFVPMDIAATAMKQFTRQTGKVPTSRKLQQKVWLRAALLAIKHYQHQSGSQQATDALALQDERLRAVLVNCVSPAVRLVEVEPVGQPSGPPQRAIYRGYTVHVELPSVVA